jgi:hypothetical protein
MGPKDSELIPIDKEIVEDLIIEARRFELAKVELDAIKSNYNLKIVKALQSIGLSASNSIICLSCGNARSNSIAECPNCN